MRHRGEQLARGATLVEMIASVTILAIVAGTTLPVIHGATDAYAGAAETRRAAERGAYALERMIRLLRDAPEGATPGTLGIRASGPAELVFSDNRGVRLVGTSLMLVSVDGSESVLCEDVGALVITPLASDGVTVATPGTAQRFHIDLTVRSLRLTAAVFPRILAAQE
jgi:type II secretory pathway pseudopilin PulG